MAQWVVQNGRNLSSVVDAFLEVDVQQLLQVLLFHDGRDSRQQQRARTHGHRGLRWDTPQMNKLEHKHLSTATVYYLKLCDGPVQKRSHSDRVCLVLENHIMVLGLCQTFSH